MTDFAYSILIVDDSEDYRTLLGSYLSAISCDIHIATDGEEAVDLFETHAFDLIIMDIIMPLMDGVDAIRAIRKIEARDGLEPTPILAISAEDSIETGVDSMGAGASRMLLKPVSRQSLVDTSLELLKPGRIG